MNLIISIPMDPNNHDSRFAMRRALDLLDDLAHGPSGVATWMEFSDDEPGFSPPHPGDEDEDEDETVDVESWSFADPLGIYSTTTEEVQAEADRDFLRGDKWSEEEMARLKGRKAEPLVLNEVAFLGAEAPAEAPDDPAHLPPPEPRGVAWIEHVAGSDHEDAPPIPMVGPAALAEAAREEAETPFDTIEHGPWTDANDEQLLIMARAGKPFESILDVLGRSRDDVEDRLGALAPEPRNATTIGAALAKVRARIALVNAQAVTPPPPAPAPAPFWTPERDLQLAQGIIGSGLTKTIAAMGITKEEACARWNELLPRKGIAEQAKLVAKLKAAAGRAA